MIMAYKGIFKPKNPSKYKGDSSNIIYRSRWELVLMMEFDKNPSVLTWSSEEIIIPYISPWDGKRHRYFTDFYVKKKNASDGKISECLIEVKPKYQTVEPRVEKTAKKQKPTKRYLTEVKTWAINNAKWKAAKAYCDSRGWDFIIMTEDDIF